MDTDPYVVAPETPLVEVAATMAESRRGAAVVLESGALVGIFTTVDALNALAALLTL